MAGFQERNPNFYVFNAVLHMDEATPHLHIDYIPVGHYKRGQDTQNGIAQALKEMGYGTGKMAIAKWRAAEVEVLNTICREHGIEPLASEKSRGSLKVAEYKEQRHKADELAEENAMVEAEIAEKKQERDQILHYLPNVEKTSRLEFKFDDLCDELDELIKNPLSATKNRKRIAELGEEMKKRLMASYKARNRSETTVYEVREENEKLGKDWKETRERNRELSANNHKLYQEKSALQSQVDELTEFISLLERFDPRKFGEVKALQESIHRQREQQQEQPPKKKKWVLE